MRSVFQIEISLIFPAPKRLAPLRDMMFSVSLAKVKVAPLDVHVSPEATEPSTYTVLFVQLLAELPSQTMR